MLDAEADAADPGVATFFRTRTGEMPGVVVGYFGGWEGKNNSRRTRENVEASEQITEGNNWELK